MDSPMFRTDLKPSMFFSMNNFFLQNICHDLNFQGLFGIEESTIERAKVLTLYSFNMILSMNT